MFAGIIGQNIATVGPDGIQAQKMAILEDPNKLDKEFGGGDFIAFRGNSEVYCNKYSVGVEEYERFCLEFPIDFLTDKNVWNFVNQLSNELLNKKTLEENELLTLAFAGVPRSVAVVAVLSPTTVARATRITYNKFTLPVTTPAMVKEMFTLRVLAVSPCDGMCG